MKKILLLMVLFMFITGCGSKPNEVNNEIHLKDSYTSCISKQTGQYVRNTIFDDDCQSVINFMTNIVNASTETTVRMVWLYNDSIILDKTTTEDLSVIQYPTSSYIEPEGGYLKGKYTIKLYINNVYYDSVTFTKK